MTLAATTGGATIIYLSGTYSQILPQYRSQFGYMLNAMARIGYEYEAVQYPHMIDNGMFSGKWREDIWLKRLEALAPHQANCIGVIVPDVISDHGGTMTRWHQYVPIVKELGYKAAFATQLGATVDNVPWDEIDVLFVGDSEVNRRQYCWPLIDEAKRRGLWVHVGRVNTAKGIELYCKADSVDGTYFKFDSSNRGHEIILWAVRRCNARKCQQETLFSLDLLAQVTQ